MWYTNVMKLPAYAKKYFWETETSELKRDDDDAYIIGRILEHGDIAAVRWMFRTFDRRRIRQVLETKKGLSRLTAHFWRLFFNLRENDILCLRKPYHGTPKTPWPY